MSKTDIRTCRYIDCKHPGKEIDIDKDSYKLVGKTMYYHSDCYKAKCKGEWKDEETKKDLQYIKNKWVECISDTVVYSQLFRVLNEYVARGIPSKYLVFVLDYVVEHKMNLRFPNGFKYYIDKDEIKEAYQKHLLAKSGVKKQSDFTVVDSSDTPKFSVKQKPMGFKSILGGKQ